MNEEIIDLISSESENTHLDFKKEQYPIDKNAPKKPEFLKDMVAFANVTTKRDKFIIIGVEETGGLATGFSPIEEFHDQEKYQQFLNEYIEPEINFEYKEITHLGHKLGYFRLFDNDKFPYLFKKELIKNNFRFDQGCGFVRTGTSTRRLVREDFEKMYALRHTIAKDRSGDLSFRITNASFDDNELFKTKFRHLRIDAVNNSNKSIEFDVEIRIAKSRDYRVMLTQEVEKNIHQAKRDREETRGFMGIPSYNIAPPSIFLDMHVEHSYDNNYDVFTRTPERFKTIAVTVKQNSETRDIFNNQIAISFRNPSEVPLEIIARSDDFLEGPLIQKVIFPKMEHVI